MHMWIEVMLRYLWIDIVMWHGFVLASRLVVLMLPLWVLEIGLRRRMTTRLPLGHSTGLLHGLLIVVVM